MPIRTLPVHRCCSDAQEASTLYYRKTTYLIVNVNVKITSNGPFSRFITLQSSEPAFKLRGFFSTFESLTCECQELLQPLYLWHCSVRVCVRLIWDGNNTQARVLRFCICWSCARTSEILWSLTTSSCTSVQPFIHVSRYFFPRT